MNIPRLLKILSAVLILLVPPLYAEGYDLSRHVTEFKLANGMRWLIVKRTQAPVFSGVVMVRVGGADEADGKTGLAHMFEHMAFKGSERIGTRDWAKEKPILAEIERVGAELTGQQQKASPDASLVADLSKQLADLQRQADAFQVKNEIWEVLVRNGASDLNAYTTKDLTAFHASLPINWLELWARVTADMVFDPAYREFYIERKVVAEERRSSVENNPDGQMGEKLLAEAFEGGPYHWSTIGFEKDILGLTIGDARAFHDRHYVPGNMVGVLVGDLNIEEAKRIIGRNFGVHPARPVPPSPSGPGKERGDVSEGFSFGAAPSLVVAYHKPTLPDPVEYSFDVINALLCGGRSSRLQKRLVYEKRMAGEIYCMVSYPGSRLKNLFMIWVEPLKPHSPADLMKEVEAEIERLRSEPVDEAELSRVRKRVTADLIFTLDKNMGLAEELAQFDTVFGDWRLLADYPKRIAEIDSANVMAAARKYLDDSNRVVIKRHKGKR
ncbi:MAG: pitrilysin family protein [Pseudomonadota bacterium]